MKPYVLLLAVLTACAPPPAQSPERDRELESLRARYATQTEAIKALRQKVDRMEIDLEHAVNRKCDPKPQQSTAPAKKRIRIGVA